MKKVKAKVISNEKIAPDHYRMALGSAYLAGCARPGQFINVKCSDSYTPLLRKPFGFHRIRKNEFEILYKIVGPGTRLLTEKKKGDVLGVIGPLGNGFNLQPTAHSPQPAGLAGRRGLANKIGGPTAIIIGGGHGVAPLVALAEEFIRKKRRVTVYLGARTKKHLVCEKDFKKLGIKTYIATDDGSKGRKGMVTELLSKDLRRTQNAVRSTQNAVRRTIIYACGPKPMLKAVACIADKNNISCQVSLEEYMGCGIGTCMGCAVYTKAGYKLVCKDGPVFDAKEVVW